MLVMQKNNITAINPKLILCMSGVSLDRVCPAAEKSRSAGADVGEDREALFSFSICELKHHNPLE